MVKKVPARKETAWLNRELWLELGGEKEHVTFGRRGR